jgi:hypothetical protein
MDMKNVGGTPGGMGTFLLGLIMAIAGGYLLFHQVQVTGGYWGWMGYGGAGHSFGITLLPVLFGIGILFVNGKSVIGRLLTFGGAIVIVTGVIANLDIQFRQTSLWNVMTMLVLLVGGIGLIFRSVHPVAPRAIARRGGRDDE